ncbi:NTP transferase domain-containing protein [Tsuneonella sp. YG55]|uniref:NTP transferase domain-containing protein n=1 Tax=Tsuneonella litorea TaxID=2976475 RepID=A0A9X2VYN5_9SPHN|nr:NTP transferase domain-containing protein [Tsuneonella litorea]MCT2557488.1 NTP transferase domain-containing protein [Tsuneonella litorea]
MSAFAPAPEGRCAFALLAAGEGARFGPGKLHADLDGRPLWRWAIESGVEAGFAALHVVTNDARIAAESAAAGWIVHASPDALRGIAASIRIAAHATRDAERTILALADMPFVEPGHFRRLAAHPGVVFTRQADGRPGVPAGFPAAARERLMGIEGDRGAASLDWPGAEAIDPPTAESLFDVDTPVRLQRARAIALRRRREACR